jgi:hypothetical protein
LYSPCATWRSPATPTTAASAAARSACCCWYAAVFMACTCGRVDSNALCWLWLALGAVRRCVD